MSSYLVGSRVQSTVTFVPESGNTSLANITARLIDASGTESDLTVVEVSTDVYSADISIADDGPPGPYTVRWESSTPKIVVEVSFTVVASSLLNP